MQGEGAFKDSGKSSSCIEKNKTRWKLEMRHTLKFYNITKAYKIEIRWKHVWLVHYANIRQKWPKDCIQHSENIYLRWNETHMIK